jgi:hypothetical protein
MYIEEDGTFEIFSTSSSYEIRKEFAPEDFMCLTSENALKFSEEIMIPELELKLIQHIKQYTGDDL